MWLYAICSLTVARMLGVAISTIGLKLQIDTILFVGWFGPRGIASIVYDLLIVDKEGLQGSELMFYTMVITVFISIFAHGLTAFPGANWYANRMSNQENHDQVPVRLPWRQ